MSDRRYGKVVSIRLNDGGLNDWELFLENCKTVLHTDTCYVVQQLIRAFNQSVGSVPNPSDPVVIQTLKQHIQINLGCEFNYNVSKARRSPLSKVAKERNLLVPEIIEQWDRLTEKNREYWKERLIEKGIIDKTPPSISTRARKPRKRKPRKYKPRKKKHKFFKKIHRIVLQLSTKLERGILGIGRRL